MAATDFAVTLDTKNFDKNKHVVLSGFDEIVDSASNASSSLDELSSTVATAAAAYFSVQQAQEFLNRVIEIRGEMQKLDIAFTTMLKGNKEASSQLLNELVEFSSVTPFGLMDAASGAKQLLAYGFEVKNVVKDMEMLGNIAAGVTAPLNDIVFLYGTLKASGRVATMDIRQFAGRGIPIYRELAAVLDVAEGEIDDLVSAGRVGFKDIEKAFQRMTGQGGTFYNLMREQSKSLPGQISNLEDSIDMMFNEIGEASEEAISKGIEGVAYLVDNYKEISKTILEIAAAYGVYKAAIATYAAYMGAAYGFEIAQLRTLVAEKKMEMDADLATAVTKNKITLERAKEVQALRVEVAEKIKAATITERTAVAEAAQMRMKAQNAAVTVSLAKLRVTAAQEELAAAIASGDATAINTAQTEYNNAVKARNIASQEASILARQADTAATNAQSASQARATLVAQADIVTKKIQITNTNILTVATNALKVAWHKLTAAMMANPIMLIAAAIAALAYGMYKLITYQSEATKKQNKLNDAFAASGAEAAKEIAELDELKGKLKGCKEGTEEYKKTKEEIVNQFGKYDDTLKAETLSVQTLAEKYDVLIGKIKESTNQRMYNDWLANNNTEYNEAEAEYLNEIYAALKDTHGIKKAAETYQNLLSKVYAGYNPTAYRNSDLYKSLKGAGMTEETNALVKLWRDNQKLIEEAKIRFGIVEDKDNDISGLQKDGVTTTAGKANKEYWETIKKNAEAARDALAWYEVGTEEWLKQQALIDKADAKLAVYAKKSVANTADIAQEYQAETAKELRDQALEMREASIEGMEEGFAKEREQIELEYHKTLQEVTDLESEMIEKLRDYEEKQWEQENPEAKKQGKAFDRSSITADNLTDEQKKLIADMYTQANTDYLHKNTELGKELLDNYRTYEEQRLAIAQKYSKIRADIDAVGGTQGHKDEATLKEQEELAQIDEQFAMRSAEYEAWANTITNISLDNLKKMLAEAESALAQMEKENPGDPKLAGQRAKVNRLKKEFEGKQAEDDANPNKRTLEQWKNVQDVIKDSIDVFEELGDAIGGTAGEAISAAMEIASSTLQIANGIVQLMQSSTGAISGVSKMATQEMSALEKASVILAIISAAMQIIMKIASLFNQDEKRQENIDDLQRKIDDLEFRRTNPEIVNMWTKRGKAAEKVNAIYEKHLDLLIDIALANSDWESLARLNMKGLEQGSEGYNRALQEIVKSYADLSYREASLTTADRYANAGKQLEYIAEQQLLIAEQQRQEEEKKKTDEDKLAEWTQKQEELALEAAKVQAEIIEDILGGSARNIAEQLSDAYWEAAEEGKNAMESWAKETDKIMSDIGKNMLITKWLEPRIGTLIDEVTRDWFDNKGNFQPDEVEESMPKFSKGLEEIGYAWSEVASMMPDWMKESIDDLAERQSSSRGIATASQESVDENNARLTTIQAHTASIAGNVDEMVKEIREQRLTSLRTAQIADDIRANTIEMVKHLQGIETNTNNTNSKLDKISSTLTDIQLKGVKMK